jgi:hypothetical protein
MNNTMASVRAEWSHHLHWTEGSMPCQEAADFTVVGEGVKNA